MLVGALSAALTVMPGLQADPKAAASQALATEASGIVVSVVVPRVVLRNATERARRVQMKQVRVAVANARRISVTLTAKGRRADIRLRLSVAGNTVTRTRPLRGSAKAVRVTAEARVPPRAGVARIRVEVPRLPQARAVVVRGLKAAVTPRRSAVPDGDSSAVWRPPAGPARGAPTEDTPTRSPGDGTSPSEPTPSPSEPTPSPSEPSPSPSEPSPSPSEPSPSPSEPPFQGPQGAGASLPIDYGTADLPGRVLFVAPTGSDSAPGTVERPLGSVTAALKVAATGERTAIVARGGLYREGALFVPATKSINLRSYPGEIAVFRGSRALAGAWRTESDGLRSHAYSPQPVDYGSGLGDSSGFADPVAQHPDQVWVDSRQLRQVLNRTAVTTGTFFVDRSASRVLLAPADQSAGVVEASGERRFITIRGDETTLEGIKVERFSNSLADYGVIRIEHTTDRTDPLDGITIADVVIDDSAMQAVQVLVADSAGFPRRYPEDLVNNVTFRDVTISDSNWMGIAANWVDGLYLDRVRIVGSNGFGEFRSSPQSGALKTSRVRDVRVAGSVIANNRSHALWFDQSNVKAVVVGNEITGNAGAGVFWEISDDIVIANNYISVPASGSNAVKVAGASGVRLINNTLVGGRDVLGVYTDSRSKPGCASATAPLCDYSYSSDRDGVRPRPATLDWMPRIDLLLNNILAHPASPGYCAGRATMCVTTTNAGATVPLNSILHSAQPTRGIPSTRLEGNVYVDGNGAAIRVGPGSFSTLSPWRTFLASEPLGLVNQEGSARTGDGLVSADGRPTGLLAAEHNQAAPIPTDATINAYISSGTRHYGVLWR